MDELIYLIGLSVVISGLGLMHAPGIIERNLLRPYYLLRDRAWSTLITCGFVGTLAWSASRRLPSIDAVLVCLPAVFSPYIFTALVVLLLVHLIVDKDRNVIEELPGRAAPVRILSYAALLLTLACFGATQSTPFIYFQF